MKNIEFYRISSVKEVLSKYKKKKFIIDENTCSDYFEKIIKKNNKIINFIDPVYSFKAIKSNKRN